MTTPSTSEPSPQVSLRDRARTRLQASSPSLQMARDPSAALRVLFDLASSPNTSHEALALLHELQVHQVELELQREELLSSRHELELAWDKQLRLSEAAPQAQVLLDGAACVLECNAKALSFLKTTESACLGKPLNQWISSEDSPQVSTWLNQALMGLEVASLIFRIRSRGSAVRSVCAAAKINPTGPGLLLVWVETPDAFDTPFAV